MIDSGPLQAPHDAAQLFVHVRVLIGMIVGLGLTHLLRNFADLMDRPDHRRVYWVHLLWALFVFLFLLQFWWWEFRLSLLQPWSFNVYVFISGYALVLYLLCAFTFSGSADQHPSYREYFYARRHWFFGTLAFVYTVDLWDTWIKGADYFRSFGVEYPIRNIGYAIVCLVAIFVRNPTFHGAFAVLALAYQVSWVIRRFEII